MATREENSVRLELPSTSGVECEVRKDLNRDEYVFTFFQNERKLKSTAISVTQVNQDKMVDLLSDAGVEFFSFSAIFDVADLLLSTIKSMTSKLHVEEEFYPVETKITKDEISRKISDKYKDKEVSDTPTEIVEESKLEPKVKIDVTDKLLSKFTMPYSQGGFAEIYYTVEGKYAIIIFRGSTPLIKKSFTKENINQDKIVTLITESGVDFLSFSAIYDSAEQIEKIILHPEEFTMSEDTIQKEQKVESYIEEEQEVESSIVEDDLSIIDLSELDTSEYTKAEDFDKFLVKVKEFVSQGQPLPVKEMKIEQSGGSVCIILRKMEKWYLRFRLPSGSLTPLTEVKINQDEIAKVINKDIPQISFSYLYDASEKVLQTIELLSQKPMEEIIINVAVGHYLEVIEQFESKKDMKGATKVTQVLYKRFQKERNAKGILQFGKKLVYYYDEQKKSSDAGKLRDEIIEELLELEPSYALEFVDESIKILIEQENNLSAANLIGLALDFFLADETKISDVKKVIDLAQKQVDSFEKARLPVVMWENSLRYGHFLIRYLSKSEEIGLSSREIEKFQEIACEFLDKAFNAQDEKKAHFELMESLETTLKLIKTYNYKPLFAKYADRLILISETQNKKDIALEYAKDGSSYLMDSDNHIKACEYGNKTIKYFYELNKIEEAVDFSLEIVKGLLELKESNAARDYLKFVVNLIDQAYASNESRRIEKQLALGDLFGKLGMKDHSKVYIQTALDTIKDQKKREKIVLQYVDELLQSQAVLTAQEMINLELGKLLTEKKISDVLKFCRNFIDKLKEHKQFDMIFEYMKYSASLMLQTDETDYDLLMDYIKELLLGNQLDRAAFLLDQLTALQIKNKDQTRAIDYMGRFVTHLFENSNRYDLLYAVIQKIAETYNNMGDLEGAIESLIDYQKESLKSSVILAQKITDMILKQLEPRQDFKKSITIVSRLIEKQFEMKRYQDAYLFIVQTARYYERLGDISQVIKYLEKNRDIFLEHGQYEDANRMTDLIIRFGRSHSEYKLAINAVKNYAKNALDRGDAESASTFAIEMAKLLEEDSKADKALEFLQMIFNTTYETNKEAAIRVFERIVTTRHQEGDFKKVTKKHFSSILQKYPDTELLLTIKRVMKPEIEEFFEFAEPIYDLMLQSENLSKENADLIVNQLLDPYEEGKNNFGDELVLKYSPKFFRVNQFSSSSRLMATLLEKTTKPISEVLPHAFQFIKELISGSLLEIAREYTDRILQMVSDTKRFGSEGNLLAAKITEKFALFVAFENPDLASEYAYQSAEFYRRLNNFEGIVNVYTNLGDKYPSPKRAIRTYKRGIQICKKFNAEKYEAQLLAALTSYLIRYNHSTALGSFQQTLEKLESLEDLDALFNTVHILIETAIEYDNLKIAYSYLDYICRLSAMINQNVKVAGILVYLLNDAKEKRDKIKADLVQKYLENLGISPKKYKKEFKALLDKRASQLGVLKPEELIIDVETDLKIETQIADEPSSGVKPKPIIVDTSQIIIPDVSPKIDMTEDLSEEKIDEEFVKVIKGYEIGTQATDSKPVYEKDKIPSLDSVEKAFFEATQELKGIPTEKPVVKSPKIDDEILELPISKSKDVSDASLSDDEISELFSPQFEEKVKKSEIKPIQKKMKAGLSDSEISELFSSQTPSEPKEILQDYPDEGEWEVDSFGRLWRKESGQEEEILSPETKKITQKDTPDLSPLERMVQEESSKPIFGAEKVEEPREYQERDDSIPEIAILEKAIADTQNIISKSRKDESSKISADSLFKKEVPDSLSSIVRAISEDEQYLSSEELNIPKVAYGEVKEESKELSKETKVKPPDLAELFSDALSELSSIGGESGKEEKKRKR